MNHFLNTKQLFGVEVPDRANITITNAQTGPVGNLGDAATACKTLYGKAPTFVLVDFFEQGSAISTVDSLNEITAVGRTQVTAAQTQTQSTNGSVGKRDGLRKLLLSWPGCMGLLFVIVTPFSLL